MKSIRKAYHPSLTVLVVEDTTLFVREIKHALPQHTVVFARSLEEALKRYDDNLPDLTFLDIDLPDGNGFDLLDHIRQRDPNACVVILTGSKLDQDIEMARSKGARGYIIKPFTRAKIDQIIDDYLDRREKEMSLAIKRTQMRRQQAVQSQADDHNA